MQPYSLKPQVSISEGFLQGNTLVELFIVRPPFSLNLAAKRKILGSESFARWLVSLALALAALVLALALALAIEIVLALALAIGSKR